MKRYFTLFAWKCCALLLFMPLLVSSQPIDPAKIIVSTSNDYQESNWREIASGDKTITGDGLEGRLMEASRFLAQATLGGDEQLIAEVAKLGMEQWLDQQIEKPPTYYMDILSDVYNQVYENYVQNEGNPNDFRCRPKWYHANYGWWQMVMTSEDLVRQRVALALSQILVISKNSNLENYGWAIASYYDIFLKHAFGNYKDILMDVTYHPAMGDYLSHLNNPKSNPEKFQFPDENYAREFMQLFSIGVYELNLDGTKKTDLDGNFIHTYDNSDIDNLAKVFTGFGAGGTDNCGESFAPAFGLDIRKLDMTIPMEVYDDWHEAGEKTIIGDYVIPAGQSGKQDINQAITHLFNHPNVGPFISHKLIQHLVKSNPTPSYVERVATIFNDNGQGVRGDMAAVIKAILLDSEARSCEMMSQTDHGKLREPIIRYTHFAKAVDNFSTTGRYWDTGENYYYATGQMPMHAPSVFNFFQSEYQPQGALNDLDLAAPEFQLLNSVTGLEYFNEVDRWTFHEQLFRNWEDFEDNRVYIDVYEWMGYARDPEVFLNKLDVIFTHGQLGEAGRAALKKVLEEHDDEGIAILFNRAILGLYYIMVHPDYLILK